jgi:hypothetical protein
LAKFAGTLSVEDGKGERSSQEVSADETAALRPFGGGWFSAMFDLYYV